jgi:ubiquinone/menaquinone biosynthesis C-methylase UbiE
MASDQIAARFDRWAPSYDSSALQSLLYKPMQSAIWERCAARVSAPRRLIDIGCGTGQLLAAAGQRFPDAQLVGVDLSKRMLSIAASAGRDQRSACLVQARAERLPFADAVFDVAAATLTYRHWSDQHAGVAEIGRVLSDGGIFGLAAVIPRRRGAIPRWCRTRSGRLPATLAAGLANAGLRVNAVETISGVGPISEVTLMVATRRHRR